MHGGKVLYIIGKHNATVASEISSGCACGEGGERR